MGYAGIPFAHPVGLPGENFSQAIDPDDQQLLPESEMSDYRFEGIIGQSLAI